MWTSPGDQGCRAERERFPGKAKGRTSRSSVRFLWRSGGRRGYSGDPAVPERPSPSRAGGTRASPTVRLGHEKDLGKAP